MKIAPDIQDSLELRFSALARKRNASGEKILSLGLGEPGFPTPEPIVEAAYRAMKDGFTRYSNPLGLVELREAIADKLRRENGIACDPGNIVVAPGAKQALSLLLMAILRPGDEAILPAPCYPSFGPQFKLAEPDVVLHSVDLRRQDFGVDWDAIDRLINPRTKAILLNFPHNPTGRMLDAADIDRLAAIAERFEGIIISDEIYERLNFSGTPHRSLAAHPALAAKTATINGFSKAYAMTGWRLGYLVADPAIVKTVSIVQQHLNTNTCTFIQKAACEALRMDQSFLAAYNAELKAKALFLARTAAARPALRLVEPAGGLFGFLDIGGTGLDSDAFAAGLLESQGVAATPGVSFGRNWNGHVRISLAVAAAEFEEAVRRLGAFVDSLPADPPK